MMATRTDPATCPLSRFYAQFTGCVTRCQMSGVMLRVALRATGSVGVEEPNTFRGKGQGEA